MADDTSGGEASGTVAPTSKNFFTAFLSGLGLPVTSSNLRALYSVEQLEHGTATTGPDQGIYNPLNVVQPEPGSSPINSVGVQRYASFDTGVAGSVKLFSGEHWAGVRAALKRGNSVQDVLDAFKAAYTWDTGVNFPANTGVWQSQATRSVGPNAGSASMLNPANGTGGAAPAAATGTGGNAAADSIFGPLGSILGIDKTVQSVINFAIEALFVVGGIGLVVLGVARATANVRQETTEKAGKLASLAAL